MAAEVLSAFTTQEGLTMTRTVGVCMAMLVLILGTYAVAQVPSCGQTVTGLVTLEDNLTCPTGNGLSLASNATLDCAGHILTGGDQSGQYGIYVRNVSNATVRNCKVEHFAVGIRLRQSTNSTLQNNVSQHNTTYGIEISASTGALLQGNTVYNNSDEGIHVSGPSGDAAHRIEGNTVNANADEGIYLLNTHANTIAGNTVHGHGTAGIYIKGSNRNTIDGNTFTNDPIQLVSGSQQNVLRNNTIIGQRIKFDGASNNQVDNLSIQELGGRPSNAYEFTQSSGNTIVDSQAIDPVDYHIRAANSSKNNVFTRFSVDSPLRCFVDGKSSVTVTNPAGTPLTCK
jgi:parallel beta-helix repeat protein